MAKEFGTIKIGFEDEHSMMLLSMEGNLLKLHREEEKRDGRRAVEAIHICLLTIEGYLTDTEYDFSAFLTPENQDFVRGLLMSFDPFTNDEVRFALEHQHDLKSFSEAKLRLYFQKPVMCLLRIEKSIENWIKEMGANGYFIFLEETIGEIVEKDLKMNFSVGIS